VTATNATATNATATNATATNATATNATATNVTATNATATNANCYVRAVGPAINSYKKKVLGFRLLWGVTLYVIGRQNCPTPKLPTALTVTGSIGFCL
jgi:hypothetical protein